MVPASDRPSFSYVSWPSSSTFLSSTFLHFLHPWCNSLWLTGLKTPTDKQKFCIFCVNFSSFLVHFALICLLTVDAIVLLFCCCCYCFFSSLSTPPTRTPPAFFSCFLLLTLPNNNNDDNDNVNWDCCRTRYWLSSILAFYCKITNWGYNSWPEYNMCTLLKLHACKNESFYHVIFKISLSLSLCVDNESTPVKGGNWIQLHQRAMHFFFQWARSSACVLFTASG